MTWITAILRDRRKWKGIMSSVLRTGHDPKHTAM